MGHKCPTGEDETGQSRPTVGTYQMLTLGHTGLWDRSLH